MHRANLARAAFFLFVCLLLNCQLSGCSTLSEGQPRETEEAISSGKSSKTSNVPAEVPLSPDEIAHKKMALVMSAIGKGDFVYGDVKAMLKNVQKDPYTSVDNRTQAGYLLTLVEKLEARQKDIEHLRQKSEKCQKEKEEISKEKDDIINTVTKERDDLKFKLKKLEETFDLTEKRRGMRR